jgi:hypothetical protein
LNNEASVHAYNPKGREKEVHNFSLVSDLVTPREKDRNLHKAECSHVAQHETQLCNSVIIKGLRTSELRKSLTNKDLQLFLKKCV